jgi:hypothetical protein
MDQTFIGADYAAFTTVALAVKPRAGRVAKLSITTPYTTAITIYDNPSAAAGTVLFVSATAPPVGIIPIDIPAKTGIYLVPGAGGAGVLVFS